MSTGCECTGGRPGSEFTHQHVVHCLVRRRAPGQGGADKGTKQPLDASHHRPLLPLHRPLHDGCDGAPGASTHPKRVFRDGSASPCHVVVAERRILPGRRQGKHAHNLSIQAPRGRRVLPHAHPESRVTKRRRRWRRESCGEEADVNGGVPLTGGDDCGGGCNGRDCNGSGCNGRDCGSGCNGRDCNGGGWNGRDRGEGWQCGWGWGG